MDFIIAIRYINQEPYTSINLADKELETETIYRARSLFALIAVCAIFVLWLWTDFDAKTIVMTSMGACFLLICMIQFWVSCFICCKRHRMGMQTEIDVEIPVESLGEAFHSTERIGKLPRKTAYPPVYFGQHPYGECRGCLCQALFVCCCVPSPGAAYLMCCHESGRDETRPDPRTCVGLVPGFTKKGVAPVPV